MHAVASGGDNAFLYCLTSCRTCLFGAQSRRVLKFCNRALGLLCCYGAMEETLSCLNAKHYSVPVRALWARFLRSVRSCDVFGAGLAMTSCALSKFSFSSNYSAFTASGTQFCMVNVLCIEECSCTSVEFAILAASFCSICPGFLLSCHILSWLFFICLLPASIMDVLNCSQLIAAL